MNRVLNATVHSFSPLSRKIKLPSCFIGQFGIEFKLLIVKLRQRSLKAKGLKLILIIVCTNDILKMFNLSITQPLGHDESL